MKPLEDPNDPFAHNEKLRGLNKIVDSIKLNNTRKPYNFEGQEDEKKKHK